ncbi:MAG: nucleotide exchange factor GrpE [Eubacteriaceae bacterium]|nr:nucleotide exchange factor GrpE [Eubacteriaceae bacterium]
MSDPDGKEKEDLSKDFEDEIIENGNVESTIKEDGNEVEAEEDDLAEEETTSDDDALPEDDMPPEEDLPLDEETTTLAEQLSNEKEKYLRLYADFDNFRRRTAREKADIYEYANAPLMEKLLSILDTFGHALSANTDTSANAAFLEGFEMTIKNLTEILEAEGLKQNAQVGQKFDPNFHNAIALDMDTSQEDDVITEIFLAGYQYKDKVLRPALVKVNKITKN